MRDVDEKFRLEGKSCDLCVMQMKLGPRRDVLGPYKSCCVLLASLAAVAALPKGDLVTVMVAIPRLCKDDLIKCLSIVMCSKRGSILA